jgi:hypothetical protein
MITIHNIQSYKPPTIREVLNTLRDEGEVRIVVPWNKTRHPGLTNATLTITTPADYEQLWGVFMEDPDYKDDGTSIPPGDDGVLNTYLNKHKIPSQEHECFFLTPIASFLLNHTDMRCV